MYVRLLFFPLCWSSFPTAAQTSFVSVFCAVALRNLNCFVVLLPPTPPSLRFSYSPVTLISMCPEQYEWVSSPAEAAPRLQCNAFKRRLIPSRLFPFTCIPPVTHFLTPTNLLLHCLPAWLNMKPGNLSCYLLPPLTTWMLISARLSETIQLLRRSSPFLSRILKIVFRRCCKGGDEVGSRTAVCACARESLCFNQAAVWSHSSPLPYSFPGCPSHPSSLMMTPTPG